MLGSLPWLWLCIGLMIYLDLNDREDSGWFLWIMTVLLTGICSWLTADIFWSRVVIVGDQIEVQALRAKNRLSATFSEIVAYRMDPRGRWWLETESRKIEVPIRDPWELHRAIVERAPRALGGRRMRFPGVPSPEEFPGLWVHDFEETSSRILGYLGAMILAFFFVRKTPWFFVGSFIPPLLTAFARAWTRLDVTQTGVTLRGFALRKSIPWSEVKAIFCEKRGDRSFVLVGPTCAIEIPSHLAIDHELMQKVMYSLPDPVLCVNFDETTLRGYKKRKAKSKEEKADILLPALTS